MLLFDQYFKSYDCFNFKETVRSSSQGSSQKCSAATFVALNLICLHLFNFWYKNKTLINKMFLKRHLIQYNFFCYKHQMQFKITKFFLKITHVQNCNNFFFHISVISLLIYLKVLAHEKKKNYSIHYNIFKVQRTSIKSHRVYIFTFIIKI